MAGKGKLWANSTAAGVELSTSVHAACNGYYDCFGRRHTKTKANSSHVRRAGGGRTMRKPGKALATHAPVLRRSSAAGQRVLRGLARPAIAL